VRQFPVGPSSAKDGYKSHNVYAESFYSSLPRQLREGLFVSQRDHVINAHRSPRRDV
jgi:hypothetical protein